MPQVRPCRGPRRGSARWGDWANLGCLRRPTLRWRRRIARAIREWCERDSRSGWRGFRPAPAHSFRPASDAVPCCSIDLARQRGKPRAPPLLRISKCEVRRNAKELPARPRNNESRSFSLRYSQERRATMIQRGLDKNFRWFDFRPSRRSALVTSLIHRTSQCLTSSRIVASRSPAEYEHRFMLLRESEFRCKGRVFKGLVSHRGKSDSTGPQTESGNRRNEARCS